MWESGLCGTWEVCLDANVGECGRVVCVVHGSLPPYKCGRVVCVVHGKSASIQMWESGLCGTWEVSLHTNVT